MLSVYLLQNQFDGIEKLRSEHQKQPGPNRTSPEADWKVPKLITKIADESMNVGFSNRELKSRNNTITGENALSICQTAQCNASAWERERRSQHVAAGHWHMS